MVAETMGCEQILNGYTKYIQETYAKDAVAVQKYVSIVCGEWMLRDWNKETGESDGEFDVRGGILSGVYAL